jgi:hypothetical protein|tara:strand:+ start:249 stop:389 length:141 start_codon:yes stop_codon:yes gene_type:complete
MNTLEQLIHDTPNNMELGAKIREKYSHLRKQELLDGESKEQVAHED